MGRKCYNLCNNLVYNSGPCTPLFQNFINQLCIILYYKLYNEFFIIKFKVLLIKLKVWDRNNPKTFCRKFSKASASLISYLPVVVPLPV